MPVLSIIFCKNSTPYGFGKEVFKSAVQKLLHKSSSAYNTWEHSMTQIDDVPFWVCPPHHVLSVVASLDRSLLRGEKATATGEKDPSAVYHCLLN